jgi:hypothetical protein
VTQLGSSHAEPRTRRVVARLYPRLTPRARPREVACATGGRAAPVAPATSAAEPMARAMGLVESENPCVNSRRDSGSPRADARARQTAADAAAHRSRQRPLPPSPWREPWGSSSLRIPVSTRGVILVRPGLTPGLGKQRLTPQRTGRASDLCRRAHGESHGSTDAGEAGLAPTSHQTASRTPPNLLRKRPLPLWGEAEPGSGWKGLSDCRRGGWDRLTRPWHSGCPAGTGGNWRLNQGESARRRGQFSR